MNRQALAFGVALAAFGLMSATPAHAAGVDVGEVTRQATIESKCLIAIESG